MQLECMRLFALRHEQMYHFVSASPVRLMAFAIRIAGRMALVIAGEA